MAIPETHRANFNTLVSAAKAGALALMECTEVATGRTRYVICAANPESDGAASFVPFGHLYDETPFDPFAAYLPPGVHEDRAAAQVRETEATEREASE